MKMIKLRTALLISGNGSTAEAVIQACQRKELLGISPVCVISSRPDAGGLRKAQSMGIDTFVITKYPDPNAFGDRLMKLLSDLQIDLVSQNGWLPKTPEKVVSKYKGMIINQHPGSLDPDSEIDFGGRGMYGARVTAATIAYKWVRGDLHPYTESTIHHTTLEYDRGQMISVMRVPIPVYGSPVTLEGIEAKPEKLKHATIEVQKQLLPIEQRNVIFVLRAFAQNNVPMYHRKTLLIPTNNIYLVKQAKQLAQKLFPNG